MANNVNLGVKDGLIQLAQTMGNAAANHEQTIRDLTQAIFQGAGNLVAQVGTATAQANAAQMQLAAMRRQRNCILIAGAIGLIPTALVIGNLAMKTGIQGLKNMFGFGSNEPQSTALAKSESEAECQNQLVASENDLDQCLGYTETLKNERATCMKEWKACVDSNKAKQPQLSLYYTLRQ